MDYSQRMKVTVEAVTEFLRQYQAPTHLDEAGRMAEIRMIAEDVNSQIASVASSGELRERIGQAEKMIRRTYTARAWPSQAHFFKAMRETAPAPKPRDTIPGMIGMKTPEQIAADRMATGETVGEEWLYGTGAVKLLRDRIVDQETMKRYRSALYFKAKDIGGEEYARNIEQDLLARHDAAAKRTASGDML